MELGFSQLRRVTLSTRGQAFFVWIISGVVAWLTASFVVPAILTPSRVAIVVVIAIIASVPLCAGVYLSSQMKGRLQVLCRELHAINHLYRDVLSSLLGSREPEQVPPVMMDDLLRLERRALHDVCGKIAQIFTVLIARPCVVTVKLIVVDDEATAARSCFTWARSEAQFQRDQLPNKRYVIGTGVNSAFDAVLGIKQEGVSFFHGADLLKMEREGHYTNQREGWKQFYRSTIVVPIRHVLDFEQGKSEEWGFLCVDSKSVNRLNGHAHVELMAAFADQMFNFMSIMRQRFHFPDSPTISRNASSEKQI